MRVRVLGPLEVVDGDRLVPLGGPKERRLLAALAIAAGDVVPESRLVDVLWGDDPPRTATKTLQNYVLRLRKALQRQQGTGQPLTIVTVAPGYALRGGPDAVDSLEVSTLVTAARQAAEAGDHRRAASLLEDVVSRWRGPSLVEFADEPFAQAEAARLDELRQVAIEAKVDAELALGRHRDCVAELEALLAENPLRERRWGQLMIALYRSGRQADALRAYQRARRTLGEELGIEPGPELRRLEQAVIDQDPSLDVPHAAGVAAETGAATGAHPLPLGLQDPGARPFVGRKAHRARLGEAWRRACERQRQVVVIGGEPGIGKTSLARAVAAEAQESGAIVLYGRCDEELVVPYQPFAEALRWHVAHCAPDELATQLGPLGAELVRLVPELAERVPTLGQPAPADPALERYRLFEAVVALLGGISSTAPVLLVLDDLQWAAKPTLLLLRHVVRSTLLSRLLMVVLTRDAGPEVSPQLVQLLADLQREPAVHRLNLTGLDEEESIELVAVRAGQELDEGAVAFARTLHAETAGNPLFMGEILLHLVETGAVYRQEGRWVSDYRLEDIDLPEGVRGVVHGRLSRLSEGARRALSVGAVAGSGFSLDLLERVPDAAENPDALLDALDESVRSQVLVEVPGPPGRYAFTHAVIRQAVCQELSAARRARLHLRVGEAQEALPDAEHHLGALAHHFAEAGQHARAADYALAAGLQAVRNLAFEEAISHLERGVRGLDESPSPDRSRRADLLLALADARRLVGDITGAKAAALRAAEDARAIGSAPHLAGAAMLQAGLGVAGRPDPEVTALCEEALAALGPDAARLRVQVLARLALHRAVWEGEGPAGGALAEEALALARPLGDADALQSALFAHAVTLAGSPRVVTRRALGEELVAMAERAGNRHVLVRGLRIRGLARLEAGDITGFDEDLAQLEREANEQRDWRALSETARWRTLRALLDGRFGEVEGSIAEMLRHAGTDPNAHNAHACQMFFLRRDQGRLGELRPLAERAIQEAPRLVAFRALLALALLETGEAERARPIFEELAADDFARVPRDFTWPASLSLLASICVGLGDTERAQPLLDLFSPHSGHLAVIGWGDVCAGAVDRYLGMLEALAGRLGAAECRFHSAMVLEGRVGARPLLVRTRTWFAQTLSRRGEPGDEARADELLAEARAEAEALGMLAAVPVPH